MFTECALSKIYLVGSLRNPAITTMANYLEGEGYEVFADWFGAGPEADDKWQEYERARGRTYLEALRGPAAKNIFDFDCKWLAWADTVVMIAPAGKSGHMELVWAVCHDKRGYVLFDEEPERWDVMLQFADDVFMDAEELIGRLRDDDKERVGGGPADSVRPETGSVRPSPGRLPEDRALMGSIPVWQYWRTIGGSTAGRSPYDDPPQNG